MTLRATLVLLLAAPAARADVVVDVSGPAPFTPAQLRSALQVRLDGRDAHVAVRATGDGVAIVTPAGERAVPLAGHDGADAARLVALAAVDLLGPDDAMPPPSDVDVSLVAKPAPQHKLTVAGLGGAALWSGTLALGTVDVAIPLRDDKLVAIELGGGKLLDGGLDLTAGVVRASAGMRVGALELRAGVVVEPLSVSTGSGDLTALAGAGLSARANIPLHADVTLVLAAGVDGYVTHTDYSVGTMRVSTPWFAPWFGVGVAVSP